MNLPETSEAAPADFSGSSAGSNPVPAARSTVPGRLPGLLTALRSELNRLIDLLNIPPPITSRVLQRIVVMEQHIILPIKAACIAILICGRFTSAPWVGEVGQEPGG